ncbi:Solute carrier family 13 member 1 [Chelonia mydas]|uniref:Solute carrier family 13 member 1 n=1 Tax=Chelonia mydas TaxID=8469 RepID=M7BAK0_CHEMY|nr:Solute carrier family 13 member 1 [Chelonia mydas]
MFRCGKEKTAREQASAQVIKEEYAKLGPISYPEIATLVLFILMALLWFTREPGFIPGWSSLFPQCDKSTPERSPVDSCTPALQEAQAESTGEWQQSTHGGEDTTAEAIHVNPLYILIPTTLCTSFACLLPVSNPPNAIVYSYGHLNVIEMVKAGLGVNIIGVAVVMLAVTTWAVPLLNLSTYPSWAPDLSTVNNTGP